MLKKILLFSILFILIPVSFSNTVTSCLNSNIMQKNVTKQLIIDNNTTNIFVTENITCLYGCANNQCQSASLMTAGMFSILGIISVFLLGLGSYAENKFFVLISSMIILIMGVYVTTEGIIVDGILFKETVIRIIGIIMIMFSIYLIYSFIIEEAGEKEDV